MLNVLRVSHVKNLCKCAVLSTIRVFRWTVLTHVYKMAEAEASTSGLVEETDEKKTFKDLVIIFLDYFASQKRIDRNMLSCTTRAAFFQSRNVTHK